MNHIYLANKMTRDPLYIKCYIDRANLNLIKKSLGSTQFNLIQQWNRLKKQDNYCVHFKVDKFELEEQIFKLK